MVSRVALTPHGELTVLKLLAAGKGLEFVAAATTVQLGTVEAIAKEHGWPDRDKLSFAAVQLQARIDRERRNGLPHGAVPPPPPPRPVPQPPAVQQASKQATVAPRPPIEVDKFKQLIDAGKKSRRARTQAMASRLITLRNQLEEALAGEAEETQRKKREAQAEAEALREIEALKAQLAAAQAKLARPRKKPGKKKLSRGALIRGWAAEHGYSVSSHGKIPDRLVAAYDEATHG
jgi:hypothetical protein